MPRRRRRGGYGGRFAPYVPVARRRRQAERFAAEAARDGRPLQPIVVTGRAITATFWGRSWCANLEAYGDFENRLPRGRTYVRNGSVIDLSVERGRVDARVSGSALYEVSVEIDRLPEERWERIRAACAGRIESLVELLGGRLSDGVMRSLTSQTEGIFPEPAEIGLRCSCPDHATVCKHVAAVLYGIGVRFDADPGLFFALRGVDQHDLIASATESDLGALAGSAADASHIADEDLAGVFGIEFDEAPRPRAADDPSRDPSRDQRGGTTAPGPKRRAARTGRTRARPAKKAERRGRRGPAAPSPEPPAARRPDPDSGRGGAPDPATLTAKELVSAGIPRSTIASWLERGVLRATAKRGVYAMTDETGPTLETYLQRDGQRDGQRRRRRRRGPSGT